MKKILLFAAISFTCQVFSQSSNFLKGNFVKNWIYIPEMTFKSTGMVGNDSFNYDNRDRVIHQTGFFIYNTEITNKMYLQFLQENANRTLVPDTNCWNTDFGVDYHTPLVEKYLRNEVYSDYPVVGVSQKQAIEFCIWMEKKINKDLMNLPKSKDYIVEVTLPTSDQWESAFYRSYQHNQKDSQMVVFNIQDMLVSSKGKELVNYGQESTSEGYVLRNYTSDGGLFPTSSEHFKPNKLKISDLLGNVAELTLSPAYNTIDSTIVSVDKLKRKVHYIKATGPLRDTIKSCHYWGKMENIQKITPSAGYIAAKGGSWLHGVFYMQPSVSLFVKPTEQHSYIGFRPVMVIKHKDTQASQNLRIEH